MSNGRINDNEGGSSYHETTLLDLEPAGVYRLRVDDGSGGATPGKVLVLRVSGSGTVATLLMMFVWDE